MTKLRDGYIGYGTPDAMSGPELKSEDYNWVGTNTTTDFFPVDEIGGLTASQNAKVEFMTSFMRNQVVALARSLAEDDKTKAELIENLNEVSSRYLTCKINYERDLVEIVRHLEAILKVWDKTNPILGAAEAKDMVYGVLASVSEKLEEFK